MISKMLYDHQVIIVMVFVETLLIMRQWQVCLNKDYDGKVIQNLKAFSYFGVVVSQYLPQSILIEPTVSEEFATTDSTEF